MGLFNRDKNKQMNDQSSDEPRHYGKAMMMNTPEGVTIVMECAACGRIQVGPLNPVHLRSIAQLIDSIADMLGAPPREEAQTSRIIKTSHPSSSADLSAAKKEFEQMALKDDGTEQTEPPSQAGALLAALLGKEAVH